MEFERTNRLRSYSNNSKIHHRSQCIQIIKSKLFISFVIILTMLLILLCIGLVVMYDKDMGTEQTEDDLLNSTFTSMPWLHELSAEQQYWYKNALNELKTALQITWNRNRAKNIILFIGDGMGPNTVTASRIYKYSESGHLSWESFPHIGLLKTYCMDKQVPDSASSATALFGGVKTNFNTIGVDASVIDCVTSLNATSHVDTIIKWAQEVGMRTGFVTTTRVTHATPAGLYAKCPNRKWECEANMPAEALQQGCKDVARQLIEDLPGKNINVIMGGGRQCFLSNVTATENDPIDLWGCKSMDGRNLINDWHMDKLKQDRQHAVVQNMGELNSIDAEKTEFVLGIFSNGHLKYDHQLDHTNPLDMPSLEQMTIKAVEILRKDPNNGFLLVVEGGMIDQAHHRGWAKRALSETIAMDRAVKSTIKMMEFEQDESLIIVTADHSHTLSINGYPKKGSNILGVAQNSKADGIPYTTLTYATGHFGYQVEVNDTGKSYRKDPTHNANTTDYDYVQQVAIFTDENTHGGNDVAVYAKGPWAHLFHNVHDLSYVAHVISFAARFGQFQNNNEFNSIFTSTKPND